MTVLILGVVYWFWTQNQFILRKLNMLENIVYEMKTSFQVAPDSEPMRAEYAPAPSSVLGEDEDIEHEELLGEVEANAAAVGSLPPMPEEASEDASVPDALQPGGIGSGVMNVVLPDSSAKGSVLDSMTLKELRRLAEQKGVAGAEKMRKQVLIDAINAIPVVKPFEATEATLELS